MSGHSTLLRFHAISGGALTLVDDGTAARVVVITEDDGAETCIYCREYEAHDRGEALERVRGVFADSLRLAEDGGVDALGLVTSDDGSGWSN